MKEEPLLFLFCGYTVWAAKVNTKPTIRELEIMFNLFFLKDTFKGRNFGGK